MLTSTSAPTSLCRYAYGQPAEKLAASDERIAKALNELMTATSSSNSLGSSYNSDVGRASGSSIEVSVGAGILMSAIFSLRDTHIHT